MGRGRGTAVAAALLLAATLTTAGCGFGPGAEVGSVELTVTREFGTEPVAEARVEARETDTVMRVLEGEVEVETRYGGGYVSAIEGIAEGRRDGVPYDWFFFVDGIESPIGAAEYDLTGGERVWWDYRDWSATNRVPAVVGSWPAPFVAGYEGRRRPVAVECMGGGESCDVVREALSEAGAEPATGSPDGAIRVLVGPWTRVREDPAAALVERGPEESGVFADLDSGPGGVELWALGPDGERARELGPDAGLVAATRRYEEPPVWVVTGPGAAGVEAAAGLLGAEHLRERFAVAAVGEEAVALPVVGG